MFQIRLRSGVQKPGSSGVAATVALVLVSACATPVRYSTPAQLESRWQVHQASIEPIREWELRGRLALRMDSRGGQAAIHWLRTASGDSLGLNGPIGSGSVRISRDEQGAHLLDSANREMHAATIEELLYLYSGWRLPMANLDWWIRGLPVPDRAVERKLDEAGRIEFLVQDRWRIAYERYAHTNGMDLPQRVTLTRDGPDDGPGIEARLVIDRWLRVK